MNSIRVLDVTLRDGGCVNNFNFGHIYMDKILSALEKGKLDIIEVGYIDEKKGSEKERTQYINEKVIYNNFLTHKKEETEYVAMIDYPKFDVDKLEIKHSKGLDGIRVAFHKKDRLNVRGKVILQPQGKEFFTCRGKNFFTSCGKEFFT